MFGQIFLILKQRLPRDGQLVTRRITRPHLCCPVTSRTELAGCMCYFPSTCLAIVASCIFDVPS
jgi:hypothetical protein